MNRFLKSLIIIFIVMIGTILALTTAVKAESVNPIYLGLESLRSSGYGYQQSAKKVWKIASYSSVNPGETADFSKTIYCIKAGPGFGSSDMATGGTVTKSTYNQRFNLKNLSSIPSPYIDALPTGTNYNKLMWVLDHLYLIPATENTAEKNSFLKSVIPDEAYSGISSDEIDVIQQLAIWYFTNPTGTYHYSADEINLYRNSTYKLDGDYKSFDDLLGKEDGLDKIDALKSLYSYYIDNANANSSYVSTDVNSNPVELVIDGVTTTQVNGNLVFGPYKINQLIDTNYNLSATYKDLNGNTITPTMAVKNVSGTIAPTSKTLKQLVGTEFYLMVPASSNIMGITIDISVSGTNRTAKYWSVANAPNTEQPVVIIEQTPYSYKITNTIKVLNGSYNLQIVKTDKANANTKLSGAKFGVKINNGQEQEYTTDSNGMISISNISISEIGTDTIVINEKTAPAGYKTLIGSITINVRKSIGENGLYVSNMTYTTTTSESNKEGLEVSLANGTISVTVPNEKKSGLYNLQLVKVDKENIRTKLSGAKFKVELNGVTLTESATDSNGIITIPNIAIDKTGTDVITITETEAPTGYNKIIGTLKVNVTKIESADKYEAGSATFSTETIDAQKQGSTLNLTNGLITVTVPDEKMTGSYNLKLLKTDTNNNALTGAEFKITLPDGTEKTAKTNSEGIITIDRINVAQSGIDTITVEETNAPAGYKKIINSLQIEVTKAITNGVYTISNPQLKNVNYNLQTLNDSQKPKVTIDGNTINLTVVNLEKTFDLALRKYITKVNGTDVAEPRIPKINLSTLNSGTTATYNHRKNPVEVKTGDKVIYNLTIYNEGEKIGRATKIQDQLPTGLKFIQVISGNFELDSYSEADNLLKLKRTSNTDNLQAYNSTALASETIQIECEVTQLAGATDKILTNVAWISEEFDAEINKTIISQTGADRDSEPNTKPNVNKDSMEDYKGNTVNKDDLADSNYFYKGEQDDDDFEKLIIKKAEGKYEIEIIKQDATTNARLQGAVFNVNGTDKTATNENGIVNLGTTEITDLSTKDTYIIKETTAPSGYNKFEGTITLEVTKKIENGANVIDVENTTITVTDKNGQVITAGSPVTIDKTTGKITITVDNKSIQGTYKLQVIKVDSKNSNTKLAGAKFSVKVNNEDSREYTTDESGVLSITPVTITGEGTDTIIIEEIEAPTGYTKLIGQLKLNVEKTISNGNYAVSNAEFSSDTTDEQKQGTTVAIDNGTITVTVPNKKNPGLYKLQLVKVDAHNNTKKLAGAKFGIKINGGNESTYTTDENGLINLDSIVMEDTGIDVITIREIEAPDKYIQLIGELKVNITKSFTENGYEVTNAEFSPETTEMQKQGSTVGLVNGTITITVPNTQFDLSLRKFITKINNEEITSRIPVPDVTPLVNGTSTTAIYNHPKDPLGVAVGDLVEYTIRVYNEGPEDGYAAEITDHLPEQLEFIAQNTINKNYGWKMYDANGSETTDETKAKIIKTNYLSKENEQTPGENKLVAFDGNSLAYKDVKVVCRVLKTAPMVKKITNIADISNFTDENGNTVKDRDSEEDNVNVPTGKELEDYKDEEIPKDYVPGQQDDDDFEKVIIKEFDLSLRKFITKVETTEITSRIPQVDTTALKDGTGTTATYTHTKEPVLVSNGNTVIYTIRVYNEGEIDGYAGRVKDDLPEGIEFLPENETNTKYRWKMLDKDGKVVTDVADAVSVVTDYLSKEQGEARRGDSNENPALLKAYDKERDVLDYKDLKIAFKVIEPNTSDKIIINKAQISKNTDKNGKDIEDRDSTPNQWNEGEDDQDIEKIKVQWFDLSLRKWVTQAIVTENGEEKITQTGHKAEDDPEQIVKVDLKKSKIDKVTVKFRYKIRVKNEGTIAGYAKEIKDYIPQGLKFVQEDNPLWKVIDENTVTTDQAKSILLKPGDTTEVEIVLTWINDTENFGVMDNWAEISKDYNEYGAPDIDSTPDNNKHGEDDIDDAPVMIAVQTGETMVYAFTSLGVLTILASGLILIKKYVL
mgnify:CR=1 FL=1